MELFIVSGELVRLRVSQAKMAASEYLTLVCVKLRERDRVSLHLLSHSREYRQHWGHSL